jgi:hypothetical protein
VKRLIDEQLRADSPERALADLVRAMPPLADAPALNDEVFARLTASLAGPPRGRGIMPARRRWFWGAGGAVAFASAVAAASIAHSYYAHRPLPAVTPVETPAPALSDPTPPPAVAPPAVDKAAVTTAPAPPAVEAPSARLKLSTRVGDKPRTGGGEDPTLVLEAIRALRTQGDAARASALLSEYLRAHPRGVLSEDALALSIESAIARHDSRAAADLGRRYLAQFPNGRYRAFASQSVGP